MNNGTPTSPFEPGRLIGSVCAVFPETVRINLPDASQPAGQWLHGEVRGIGQVGDFTVVQTASCGLFGRITEVHLAERERLKVEPSLSPSDDLHPVGTVKLLATIEPGKAKPRPGVLEYPRLGDRVYSAAPDLVEWVAAASGSAASDGSEVVLHLGQVANYESVPVTVTPERLFGRHCAILGATGGGKSYSIARLVEQCAQFRCKVLLLDATGEFSTLPFDAVHLGGSPQPSEQKVTVPYSELEENDFLALFNPSGKVQGPKLREAIRSLRLAKLADTDASLKSALAVYLSDGLLRKEKRPKEANLRARSQHSILLESPGTPFDVLKLAAQVR
ncbi:MAG: DUF87 domain-containing protein [Verrucomicrobia bacterium]|nr:DUF87 domain-containing protein [Verrucomicrobiota bacterium]